MMSDRVRDRRSMIERFGLVRVTESPPRCRIRCHAMSLSLSKDHGDDNHLVVTSKGVPTHAPAVALPATSKNDCETPNSGPKGIVKRMWRMLESCAYEVTECFVGHG